MTRLVVIAGLAWMVSAVGARADDYVFEDLGVAVRVPGQGIIFVTEHPDGHAIGWGRHETPDFMGLLGVRLDTGEHFLVDLSMFGRGHVIATLGADGNIYAYGGTPNAHFTRVDPVTREVTDLGVPEPNTHYFVAGAMAPDGVWWTGGYPSAALVRLDTNTGEFGSVGRLTDDERNRYLWPAVAVAADGMVYCPVGLHHQELYAYDPATGAKAQILADDLTALSGSPTVWLAADGNVYGRSSGGADGPVWYRCTPTGIERVEEAPARAREVPRTSDWAVGGIGRDGVMTLTNAETGEQRTLQTDYLGHELRIYCIADEWQGRIWGGTISPAQVFAVDPVTGEITEHGKRTGGSTQVYDIIGTPEGLLLASYGGACLDLWDPEAPGDEALRALPRGEMQERPARWTVGPDGNYYVGTVPIKGHVGGGLARVTLDRLDATWWIYPIGEQSISACAPVPETGELLCATSIRGGTSAIPTEIEGHIFLWSCAEERVTHIDEPVPGADTYYAPVRADTGIIYLLARTDEGTRCVAYDPVQRETVFVGELPGGYGRFPWLHDRPVGPEGLIIGLVDDAVWAIDPADHSTRVLARHESISSAHGFMVTEDGVLYYGSGTHVWRCRLLPEAE